MELAILCGGPFLRTCSRSFSSRANCTNAREDYPSDMRRERFEHTRPILEQARKRTKPATADMYEVWCAVLYLLPTGCQWRALPSDFPKWRTVHSHFAKWSEVDD
ncbi:transposase, partial [Xanthomonas vasicola]|uniref:transposase n=2 Tax=Xanthomonas vasicola TaxID=56459 RepID=UPI0021BD5BE3